MRTPVRSLRLLGVVWMVMAILASTLPPAVAQQGVPGNAGMDTLFDTSNPEFKAGDHAIYFPWVANGEDFGLGNSSTSISIQNLEDRDSQIWIYTGNGNGTWRLATSSHLSRYASKTFTAGQLDIAPGSGAPVAVMAFNIKQVGDQPVFETVAIGGVAKQAATGTSLPFTTSIDRAVSGYNAINGREVYQFNAWYLPVVQTNCGPGGCWNSLLRVANLGSLNSAVTVRFFPADDGSGSLQTGFQVGQLVNGGDTWHIDLGGLVPEGWVGSAHIYSDGAVFPMVERYKPGYNMWLTNTGSAADFENIAQVPGANGNYALFAPHVLIDWFGWNTGINVANLYGGDNQISIQYFNMLGNATQVLSQRLAPHGMTYFYDPSVAGQNWSSQNPGTDPNSGIVGSAIIWSQYPVAAAIDATKYPETDPNGGSDLFQGTSYNATQNVYTWQAVPLVQKGNPASGTGATSGINIMNPNASAATVSVHWINQDGSNAQGSGASVVSIPAFANGFVYTMSQHNLPAGFYGSAQVVSNIPVAVVSANVDYQVDGDGSAIFNAFNPCGLYRVSAGCSYGDPPDPTQGFEKLVCVAGYGPDGCSDVTLSGVNIRVFRHLGTDSNSNPIIGSVVFDGTTNDQGIATGYLEAGNYVLCMFDSDGLATTSNGEVVAVDLAQTGSYGVADCELFSVQNSVITTLVNPAGLAEGIFNFRVVRIVNGTLTPVPGVDVCLVQPNLCTTTDELGHAAFNAVPTGTGRVELQVDGMTVFTATSGLYNARDLTITEDGNPATPAWVDFYYSATDDVMQDGWSDDLSGNTVRGSFDLTIELAMSSAQADQFIVNLFVDCDDDGVAGSGDVPASPQGSSFPCDLAMTNDESEFRLSAAGDTTGTPILGSPYSVVQTGRVILEVGNGFGQVPAGQYGVFAISGTSGLEYVTQPGFPTINVTPGGSANVLMTRVVQNQNPGIAVVKTADAQTATPEVQHYRFALDSNPSTFQVEFRGATTPSIGTGTSWDGLQVHLQTLMANAGYPSATVTVGLSGNTQLSDHIGISPTQIAITIAGSVLGSDIEPLTFVVSGGGSITFVTDADPPNVDGAPAVLQEWTLTGSNINAGTYTITVMFSTFSATTQPIAYDATSAQVSTALAGAMGELSAAASLNPIAVAIVSGGPIHAAPIVVTISGGLAGFGLGSLTVADAGLN